MKISSSRNKYFVFLAFMLLITTYLPILTVNLPPIIRSHHIWTPIWFLSLIFIFPKAITNRNYVKLVTFFAVVLLFQSLLWVGIDEWSRKQARQEMYMFLVAFSMYNYFKDSINNYAYALVVRWALLFIIITAVMSIYSSIMDPLYARKITGGEIENISDILKFGGGAYGFSSALVCLFPILVYYYRNNQKSIISKKQILLLSLLFFVTILRMQIFANIIISFFAILFSLAGRNQLRHSLIIVSIFSIIIIIIPRQFYANTMIGVSNYFSSDSEVNFKLNDFSYFITHREYEGSSSGGRAERYPILYEAFKMSPVLGFFSTNSTYQVSAGGHLFWMYKLAVYGIIFFFFYIGIFYRHIKVNLSAYDETYSFYFLISCFSIIILGLMKNLAGRDFWYMYFFVLPGLYYLPLLKKQKME